MIKWFAAALAVGFMISGSAQAACTTTGYPYPLANGSTADAGQVTADLDCAPIHGLANWTGSVGIGTTTPTDILDVTGASVIGVGPERLSLNIGSIGFNRKVATGQIYNTSYYAYQFQHTPSATQANDNLTIQVYAPNGTTVTGAALTVVGTGTVVVGGTTGTGALYVNGVAGGTQAWVPPSDARLKKNVAPLTGGLALVERLEPIRFQWRLPAERPIGKELKLSTDDPQVGFLAQDVERIVPEAVSAPKKGGREIYGLDEGALVPVLVAAVKEQQAEIEQLRGELAALKSAR
jgi:hypothetical protein